MGHSATPARFNPCLRPHHPGGVAQAVAKPLTLDLEVRTMVNLAHIEQTVDSKNGADMAFSVMSFRDRSLKLQALHLDFVEYEGQWVDLRWIGLKGNPVDGGMVIDADSFEQLCCTFLNARAKQRRVEGSTQYINVQIERRTLEGYQQNGLVTCDDCGIMFDKAAINEPENHKGCTRIPDYHLKCEHCGTHIHAINENFYSYGPYHTDGGGTIELDEYLGADVGLEDQAEAIREYQNDCMEISCIPCHRAQYPEPAPVPIACCAECWVDLAQGYTPDIGHSIPAYKIVSEDECEQHQRDKDEQD